MASEDPTKPNIAQPQGDGWKSRKLAMAAGFGGVGLAVMAIGFFIDKLTGPEMSTFLIAYVPLVVGLYAGANVMEKRGK